MNRWLWISAFAFLIPLVSDGQSESVVAGARVRVTSPSDKLKASVGTVAEVRVDSIVVVSGGGSRVVALANITGLDVSTGKRSMFLRDTALGFGIGVVGGGILGFATYEECEPDGFLSCLLAPEDRGQASMWGGVAGGAVGIVAGALIGVFHREDRWQPVRASTRVALRTAARGGISVSLSRVF